MSVRFNESVSVAADGVEIPTDPEDVHPEILADGGRCCQRCFRRLRSRQRLPDDIGQDYGDLLSFVDRELPAGAQWELLEAEWYETVRERNRLESMHPPGETTSATGCRACGAVKPHRSPATRSRSEALQAAVGASRTLQELGVAHTPLALLVEVADLKRDPDYAGDDFATFRTAVARAVRAGRRPR